MYTYVCMYACMQRGMYVYMYEKECVNMYVFMYVCSYTYVCVLRLFPCCFYVVSTLFPYCFDIVRAITFKLFSWFGSFYFLWSSVSIDYFTNFFSPIMSPLHDQPRLHPQALVIALDGYESNRKQ